MRKTIQYTNELSNFDINKIPLEQQICLLKVSDSVKSIQLFHGCANQHLDLFLRNPWRVSDPGNQI